MVALPSLIGGGHPDPARMREAGAAVVALPQALQGPFYTASETGEALALAPRPQFHCNGVVYCASKVAHTGFTPLYRFFLSSKSVPICSSSESERANSLV
jgi:hypothetical protein